MTVVAADAWGERGKEKASWQRGGIRVRDSPTGRSNWSRCAASSGAGAAAVWSGWRWWWCYSCGSPRGSTWSGRPSGPTCSQRQRGEGDAQATAVTGRAFGQDAGFYAFLRRLETYERIFADGTTTVLLRPDSDLLRYLESPRPRR